MDYALTIKEQQENNNEDKSIVISNSLGMTENGSTNDSYKNKLAAHKPYDFFQDNSRKHTETVSIKSLAKGETSAFRSKEPNCSSSKVFMVTTKEAIHTNKSVSDLVISSNSFEEPWVIQNIDLPTYKSLLFCVLEDQPPGYQEVTGKIPNNNEVRKKLFQLELI